MVAIEKHLLECLHCNKDMWHTRMTFLKESKCQCCNISYVKTIEHLICEECGVDILQK